MAQLQFSVPESAVSAESMEGAVLAHDPAPVADVVPESPVVEAVSPEVDSVEEDNFFPLEIDKGE